MQNTWEKNSFGIKVKFIRKEKEQSLNQRIAIEETNVESIRIQYFVWYNKSKLRKQTTLGSLLIAIIQDHFLFQELFFNLF